VKLHAKLRAAAWFSKKIFPIAGLCLSLHEISKPFGAKGEGVPVQKGLLVKISTTVFEPSPISK
jgi:hypothetical protein